MWNLALTSLGWAKGGALTLIAVGHHVVTMATVTIRKLPQRCVGRRFQGAAAIAEDLVKVQRHVRWLGGSAHTHAHSYPHPPLLLLQRPGLLLLWGGVLAEPGGVVVVLVSFVMAGRGRLRRRRPPPLVQQELPGEGLGVEGARLLP